MSAPEPGAATAAVRSARRTTWTGPLAATFALVCCVGVAPVVGLLSAVGLGFLIRMTVLVPLLIAALGVTAWGLVRGWSRHRRGAVVWVGGIGSVATVIGMFVSTPLAFLGLAAVIAVSVWNLRLIHRWAAPRGAGIS